MKLELSRQIFENFSNIKPSESPSSKSRDVPCGRRDRHNEDYGRFSKAPRKQCEIS